MRYLTIEEVLELHRLVVTQSGGGSGVARPQRPGFRLGPPAHGLWPGEPVSDTREKATALGFALVMNHPFVDSFAGSDRVSSFAGSDRVSS